MDCDAVPGTPEAEVCDGADNDCDGQTDEDWPSLGAGCAEGLGECAASGVFACKSGGNGVECDASPGEAVAELCDGLDNDCDGQTDEPFPGLGKSCTAGNGECATSGAWACSADGLYEMCDATAGEAGLEKCNGLDDDCDGQTDEGFRAGDPCNDGNPCTHSDVYDASCGCAGAPYVCEASECEASSTCDGLGGCAVVLEEAGTPCDDGDPATADDEGADDGSCSGVTDTDPDGGTQDTDEDAGAEETDSQTGTGTDTEQSDTETETATGALDTDTVADMDSATEGTDTDDDAGLEEITGGNDGCSCRTSGTQSRGVGLWRVLWRLAISVLGD